MNNVNQNKGENMSFRNTLTSRGYTSEESEVLEQLAVGKDSLEISLILNRTVEEIDSICAKLCEEHYAEEPSQLTAQFGLELYQRDRVAFHVSTSAPWPVCV